MLWWLIGAVAVGILLFLVLRSPARQANALLYSALRARKVQDWAAADKFYGSARRAAGRLQDPLRSILESQVDIEWAGLLHRQGRMEAAEERFRSGFARAQANTQHAQMILAEGYRCWGDLCLDLERHGEAEQHYRQAMKGDEATGNLAGVIFDLQRLGDALICQERRADAAEAIEQAITLESRVVHEQLVREGKNPEEHPVISMSLPDLHFCREEYEEARRIYREKVAFWEPQVTRPGNIDVGRLQMRLALAEERTGHRAEAIEMYGRAQSTFRREWSENHAKTAAAAREKTALIALGQRAAGV